MSGTEKTDDSLLTSADRIGMVMEQLGVTAVHIGSSQPTELAEFMNGGPDAISSMTLLNASRFPLDVLEPLQSRLLIYSGDTGFAGDAMQQAKPSLAEAEIVEFADYPAAAWTDIAADHADRISESLAEFLARKDSARPATRLSGPARRGEAGGIMFDVTGEGPAVMLFPVLLSPSQWNPVVDRLAKDFAVIRVSGPYLGMVALLENRGGDPSYHRVLRGMLHDANVGPPDKVLEVGCGSGVTSRWLVREGHCGTPVTAVDLNPFLLGEAKLLSEAEGLDEAIDFRHGNAAELPFPDNSFDAVLSVTVIEECDADKAIAEMVRVVKPGGRVAIMVRACDMQVFWNLPLDPEIKAKAEAPMRQVAENGCADSSLMRRFQAARLEDIIAYPSFHGCTAFRTALEPSALSHLNDTEKAAWHAAKTTALANGTFYMMHPAHCAIGTKSP
jgi:SAM-dependent methyltransferase